jgi:hypothetical protein
MLSKEEMAVELARLDWILEEHISKVEQQTKSTILENLLALQVHVNELRKAHLKPRPRKQTQLEMPINEKALQDEQTQEP